MCNTLISRFLLATSLPCLLCVGVAFPARAATPAASREYGECYSCVVHVHSKISKEGRYELAELTEIARAQDVDAIFLSDNRTAQIQYGLPPLRHVLWVGKSWPSVMSEGPAGCLAKIATENSRQSDVLYIAGAEICPRFYWVRSDEGDLLCRNHQRNLIVLGVEDAEVLRCIPEAAGYVRGRDGPWILLTRAVVVLIVLACISLFAVPAAAARRNRSRARTLRKRIALLGVLPLVAAAVALNVAASRVPSFRIYGEDPSMAHEQAVIDFLGEKALVHYWAHPEASDYGEHRALGVGFCALTDPYPEVLTLTEGYTGFGGVYEDRNEVILPGNEWDEVLSAYARGERRAPVWCFGEMLYHYEGQAGKKLGNVETMVWSPGRSSDALLEAMRCGRFYSRRNCDGQSLAIRTWEVSGGLSGETVDARDGKMAVALSVSSVRPGIDVLIQLVANGGRIMLQEERTTPCKVTFSAAAPAGEKLSYCRAVVTGSGGLRLVTNPIFVRCSERAKNAAALPFAARLPPADSP